MGTAVRTPWAVGVVATILLAACLAARSLLGPAWVLAVPFAGDVERTPRIELSCLEWDFGHIPRGPVVEARFDVRNRGGRRLILRRETGECECTEGGPLELILSPGATGELVVPLETAHFSGGLRVEVPIRTNDPERPLLTLVLLADVSAD